MEDGSEVLDQRNINQNQTQNKLQEEVDEIISRLEEIERSGEDVPEETVKELQ
jgi:flagellar motility protein MotE (MotC chaperone)